MNEGIGYAYRLTITRPGEGPVVQDPETGVITGGNTMETILDCPADVQDGGAARPRNSEGMAWLQADATAFVPPSYRDQLLAVIPEDIATVFYPNSDRTAEGNVKMVRELDDALDLVYR